MTTNAKLAKAMREVVDEVRWDGSRWTQGAVAINPAWKAVPPIHPTACSWCAKGFIIRDRMPEGEAVNALLEVIPCDPNSCEMFSVAEHNDWRIKSPADFCAWWTRAADWLEAPQP